MNWFLSVIILAGPVVVVGAAVGILLALSGIRLFASKRAAPEDESPLTPLEKAQDAIAALSPDDRERCRRWLDGRRPPGPHGDHREGITT
jgi:hypothetical protein